MIVDPAQFSLAAVQIKSILAKLGFTEPDLLSNRVAPRAVGDRDRQIVEIRLFGAPEFRIFKAV